jgi:multiple sugar transport system permease protein
MRLLPLHRIGPLLLLTVLMAFALIWMAPLLWVVTMSLKSNLELMRSSAELLPADVTLENYEKLFNVSAAPQWLLNSLIVAGLMTFGALVLSSLAGFAFARIPFPGRNWLFPLVLAGLMIPEQAVIIPLHTMFTQWDLHNTHVALIAPRLAVPVGVFLMTQFFRAIPRELEEAAMIDNASWFRIYFSIALPLSWPALTTLGIFTFLYAWNDFLWPLVSATKTPMYTITIGLSSLQGNFAQSEGLGFLMATAAFACAPILLLYIFFQKYIVRGIALGTAK